ncbi:MAG: nitrate- and nitrite sensing domain-containing protein [Actinomycetota bacterium]
MKRRLTIRTRLVLLMMLPLLALLALAAFAVSSANDRSARADEAVSLAENPGGPGDVVRALQAERAVTERLFAGLATNEQVAEVHAATDAALATGLADLQAASEDDQAAYAGALTSYSILPEIREGVLAGTATADEAWEFYGTGIRLVFDANAQTRTDVELADIRTGLDLLSGLERANEGDSALKDRLGPVIELGVGPTAAQAAALQSSSTERRVALDQVSSFDPSIGATVAADPSVLAIDGFLADVLATPEGAPIEVDTDAWQAAVRGSQAAILSQSDAVVAEIGRAGDDVVDEARTQQLIAIAAAIVTVVVAVFLVVIGSRSIARPLRRLTLEAREISRERLPAAVEQVRSVPSGTDIELPELPPLSGTKADEIGQVGEAIDRLQYKALDLAVEQAVLRHNVSDSLLNLARRTQSLAGRQLDELTELEEQETDPDSLERLFRLDHLTTRIRRHAESLIVLAGNEGPRSRGDAASIGDVLRAALGEVEDYQRVEFGPVDEAIVHGHAIADLAHLLAELLENGLQFSPPDQPVGIVGRLGDDVYRIAIVDCGVGLTDEELDEANARLRGEELPTVAPSRYLGLYVAARLAGRLGASAQLSRATTGGVLADVLVPRTLVLAGAEANLVEPRMPPPSPVADSYGAEVVDSPAPASAEVMNVPGVPPSLPYDPAAVIGDDEPLDVLPGSAPVRSLAPVPEPLADEAPEATTSEAPAEDAAPTAPEETAPGGLPQRRRVAPPASTPPPDIPASVERFAASTDDGSEPVPAPSAAGSDPVIDAMADAVADAEAAIEVSAPSDASVPDEPTAAPEAPAPVWMDGLAAPAPPIDGDGTDAAEILTGDETVAPNGTGESMSSNGVVDVPAEPAAANGAPVEPAEPAASNGAPAEPAEPAASNGVVDVPAEPVEPAASNGAPVEPAEPAASNGADESVPSNGDAATNGRPDPTPAPSEPAVPEPSPAAATPPAAPAAASGAAPLTRRVRGAQLPETGGRFSEVSGGTESLTERDADSVRDMLSRFQSGVRRGREVAAPIDEETSDE